MSLWSRLPDGLLKMKFRTWSRLDFDVRALIVALAGEQKFKCALCDTATGLVVDHDHDPEHGRGDKLTIYNIRGLVCGRCNWYVGMHEAEERGHYSSWDVYHYTDYDSYFSDHQSRVWPLLQILLKERLGLRNYWKRQNVLDKFDEWREWGGKYPWRWCFNEIKDKKYGPIRTPTQFLAHLHASMQYVVASLRRTPTLSRPRHSLS